MASLFNNRKPLVLAAGAVVLVVLTSAALLTFQGSGWVEQKYTKWEHMIPMRDGVELFTSVYIPKDTSRNHPILMRRTPYSCSPYGRNRYPASLGPSTVLLREGYIFVYQDVRGCWMSEGEFVNMTPHMPVKRGNQDIDESTDTWDTIEWLVNNIPNNNGRTGMWGISYPGFYAAASMIDAHPALKAVSPQAPIADWWYDDFHHHGAFFLPHAFRFLNSFGQERPEPTTQRKPPLVDYRTPDGYEFYLDMGPLKNAEERYFKGRIAFWTRMTEHPNYDEFWQKRNILPHLNNVAPAVMTVGGWFDAEDLYGPLQIYRSVEEKNPGIFNIIVMGPWPHGGWARSAGDRLGNVRFGSNASEFYRRNIENQFFEYHLKDRGYLDLPEAYMFETGANRWRTFEDWPPVVVEEQYLYTHSGGALSFEAPRGSADGWDEYISDPAKPVPFTQEIAGGMTRPYMTDDQRFAARRPDVLVYQTEVLREDITLAGPVTADLWVSTSGTASDWIVKLIDVFPPSMSDYDDLPPGMHTGGYQMMVRSEVIRGRFRNNHENPEPFVADSPTRVRLPLQDILHTFQSGHRIMIQIQSTWFPLVDVNPHNYVENIYTDAEEEDFIKATQRVYSSGDHSTRFVVGVLPPQ